MAEKETTVKQLQKQRQKYIDRIKWLAILLVCQAVIWWILINPDLIPALSKWMTAIKRFLTGLVWPHDEMELATGSYRVYIYRFCQWLKDMPFYSLVAWIVPRIIPVWFLVNLVQIWVAKLRIKYAQKPPKPAKQEKPRKLPAVQLTTAQKVSGLYARNREEAEERARKLQESCEPLFVQDQGLWVGNRAPGDGGKAPSDQIYRWDSSGCIKIRSGTGEFEFQLINGMAYQLTKEKLYIPMRKGVPLVVYHKNEAGKEILDMTITWIGGIV